MQHPRNALTSATPTAPSRRQRWGWFSGTLLLGLCVLGMTGNAVRAQTRNDINLKVGIVRHFGDEVEDELTLKALSGDRLTLQFTGGDGEPQTLRTDEVTLEIVAKPLPVPLANERVVLSTHRSFEAAEHRANEWKQRGIEVEIAHPDRWQVWAKRDVYSTPLLRRFLLQSLHNRGYKQAHIETETLKRVPHASWVVDGYRYHRHQLDITAESGAIAVVEGDDDSARGRLYGGSLRLQPNSYGTYTLVNNVPLEVYLRGVVPHEIGGGAPYAAVEAQAIIARTYALRNLRRFAIDNYQLCDDTNCQVYKGLNNTVPSADRAIAATRGKILTYNNELIDALYSSTSGGVTAPFEDIWDGSPRPYLQAAIDSTENVWDLSNNSLAEPTNIRRFLNLKDGFNEEGWDTFRWRESTSLEAMAEFLKKYLRKSSRVMVEFSKIEKVEVSERSRAGRVLNMTVYTDGGEIRIDSDEIRNAFYPPISTLFYIDPIYKEVEVESDQSDNAKSESDETQPQQVLDGYTFVGGGFGHGVGLSQTGAYHLADLGWSSDRILQFYYPGTELQRVSDSIVFWRDPYESGSETSEATTESP